MGILERKEREKEIRKESIIDAAQKVFFDKGLNLATMDEIAETAELAKGTLYLYYHSKEDLYLAVMMRGLSVLRTSFEAVTRKLLPTVQTLVELMNAYTDFYRHHQKFFRMLHFFNTPLFHKQVSEEMLQSCDRCNESLWGIATDIIVRGQKEYKLRSDLDPVEVALILWTTSSSFLMQIDTQQEVFARKLKIDLYHTLSTSNMLLLESVLTDMGKQELYAATKYY